MQATSSNPTLPDHAESTIFAMYSTYELRTVYVIAAIWGQSDSRMRGPDQTLIIAKWTPSTLTQNSHLSMIPSFRSAEPKAADPEHNLKGGSRRAPRYWGLEWGITGVVYPRVICSFKLGSPTVYPQKEIGSQVRQSNLDPGTTSLGQWPQLTSFGPGCACLRASWFAGSRFINYQESELRPNWHPIPRGWIGVR